MPISTTKTTRSKRRQRQREHDDAEVAVAVEEYTPFIVSTPTPTIVSTTSISISPTPSTISTLPSPTLSTPSTSSSPSPSPAHHSQRKLSETSSTYHYTAADYAVEELEQRQLLALTDVFGEIGCWQFWWALILSLFQGLSIFHIFAFVFQTADKAFWCAPPTELSEADAALWRNYSQHQPDVCRLPFSSDGTSKCTNFEFDHSGSDGAYTDAISLPEEFGLVCERRELLSVVEMCFLAGAAIGSVSSGWISDRFGRKHTLMAFALVQTVFGTILAFVNSLAAFMALRLVLGFASMTVTVVSFVLVVELVSGKWRTIIGILNILPVALTYVLTAGIAYFVRDWRMLQLAISLPELLLLLIWYCMPESPRWLLARGRLPQLYALVERAARMNGRHLQPNYKKSLEAAASAAAVSAVNTNATANTADHHTTLPSNNSDSSTMPTQTAIATTPTTPTTPMSTTDQQAILLPMPTSQLSDSPLVVVFNRRYWRTTVLMLVIWFTLIIIYFGLTLHLSNLGGNIYLNTSIAGSVEAVSICLSVFVVLRLGLRRNLIAYMLISGICCLLTNLMPHGEDGNHQLSVIALAMIAKCVIGASNAIIPIYTAMQYPTIVRNFGVGMGNLAAGLALILVPYMWLLENVEPLLPMSVMGVSGLVGAVALMLMKDTK